MSLCRGLARRGVSVAPFETQNMSLGAAGYAVGPGVTSGSVGGSFDREVAHMRRGWASLMVLLVIAAGCDWARPRFDAGNSGHNPVEFTVSAANVGALTEQLRVASATPAVAPRFVVARGHIYVGGAPIRVFDAAGVDGCSGSPRTCTPQWSLNAAGDPDVIGATLYRGGNAYDADGATSCSGSPKVCAQLWQEGIGSAPWGPTEPGRLHLQGHRSFSGHGGTEIVSIYGYDAPCPIQPADCPLRWAGGLGSGGGGGIIGGPAVEATRVFASYSAVGAPNGTLFAFDGTTGGGPQLWSAALPGVGSAHVAVAEGVVVTTVQTAAGSVVVAYDSAGIANCSGTPTVCQPLWTSDPWTGPGIEAAPAIADGVLFRAVGNQLRGYDLYGSVGCSGAPVACQKLWVAEMGVGITAPAVANGLVYVGDSTGHIDAFDAHGVASCSATTRVCAPLWDVDAGAAVGAVEVSAGRVYASVADGTVRAYGL